MRHSPSVTLPSPVSDSVWWLLLLSSRLHVVSFHPIHALPDPRPLHPASPQASRGDSEWRVVWEEGSEYVLAASDLQPHQSLAWHHQSSSILHATTCNQVLTLEPHPKMTMKLGASDSRLQSQLLERKKQGRSQFQASMGKINKPGKHMVVIICNPSCTRHHPRRTVAQGLKTQDSP